MSSKPISKEDAINHSFAPSDYCDMTIRCGASTWKAHRMIVCAQSPVFHAATEGGFMEAASKVINLEEDDPFMVDLMLTFLYTGDYDYNSLKRPRDISLVFHAKMFILADKYRIPKLKSFAEKKYEGALAANSSLENYLLSIPEVYILPASAGRLRAIAVRHARKILRIGIKNENAAEKLQQLIIEVPEWGFEVLKVFVKSGVLGICNQCWDDLDIDDIRNQRRCNQCRNQKPAGVIYKKCPTCHSTH